MRYQDIPCAACGRPFQENDDVVVCPVCGAPQHRGCWAAAGGCARAEAHGQGFVWTPPAQPEAPEARREPETTTGAQGEKRIECPQCGRLNFEHDVYCVYCGSDLHADRFSGYDPGDPYAGPDRETRNERREQIRESYERFGGLDPDSLLDGIPVCEYADYVGGARPGRLLRRISTAERFKTAFASFVPAGLFGPIWLFYRKVVKEALLASLCVLLLAIASGLLQINSAFISYAKGLYSAAASVRTGDVTLQEFQEETMRLLQEYESAALTPRESFCAALGTALNYAAFFGVPLYCAFRGLHLYRRKALRDIRDIRGRCSDLNTYRNTLLSEGGASVGLAVAGGAILVAARLLMVYIPLIIAMFR